MASSDATPIPRKNVAYRVTFPLLDADGDLVSGAAGLDSEISKDGGTFADCTNEATEIASASGMYYLDLTSTEMNADTVAIVVKTSTSGAKTTPIVLYPEEAGDLRADAVMISGDSVAADNAESAFDGAGFNVGAGQIVAASVSGAVASVTGAVTVGTNNDKTGYGLASGAITAGVIATDAIGADEIAASGANEIADAILSRSAASVEASAGEHTLCTVILAMLESSVSGSSWTIKRTDGSTTHATKAVTTSAGADPITGVS